MTKKRDTRLTLPGDFEATLKALLKSPPMPRKARTPVREMEVTAAQALSTGEVVRLQRGEAGYEAHKLSGPMSGFKGGLWKVVVGAPKGAAVRVRRLTQHHAIRRRRVTMLPSPSLSRRAVRRG